MTLPGVTFIRREPGPAVQLGRADVAMVVGLVAREPAPLAEQPAPIAVPAAEAIIEKTDDTAAHDARFILA